MKLSKIFGIVLILLFFGLFVVYLCYPSPPEGVEDNKPRRLYSPIITVREGIPIANARAHEWRKDLYLYNISVGFIGKEQIQKRKGIIHYYFYAKNADKDFDALARVDIDMEKNSVVSFSSTYGTPQELMGGSPLDSSKWKIDINDVFDIISVELGQETILRYKSPKVVLHCSESFWNFSLYSSPNAAYAEILISINSESGEILSIDRMDLNN